MGLGVEGSGLGGLEGIFPAGGSGMLPLGMIRDWPVES